ncbi:hypothetical protein KY319_01245 [Candidatus Woesearchaeota archaeon]|nr:hypothetical protein [Candidatus Woesearchaeota archaeon]
MAKTYIITGLLVIIIGLLIVIALRPPTTQTIPTQQPTIERGEPTPLAPTIERGEPTPKAEETTPLPAGTPIEQIYPAETSFWVNEVQIPQSMSYQEFIPLKESKLKTFAGSIGPYTTQPEEIRIVLCAEFYKIQAAPACESVPTIFRNGYVSFAKGYQYDEYIGAMAAKDYLAYYNVYAGNTLIATSPKAIIRTVKD